MVIGWGNSKMALIFEWRQGACRVPTSRITYLEPRDRLLGIWELECQKGITEDFLRRVCLGWCGMGFIHGCKASFPGILKLNGAWTFVGWVSLIVCINHYCPMPGYRLQLSHKPQLNPAAASCPGLSFFHSLNIPWLSTEQQFVGINKGFKQ